MTELNTSFKDCSSIITISENGVIQSVDRGACAMFGYALCEMIGKPVELIIPPPYREQHQSYIESYMKTGVKKILNKSRLVEGLHKTGHTFPIKLSVSELRLMTSSLFLGVIEMAGTICSRITVSLHNLIITGANKTCEDMLGYPPTQLVGGTLGVLLEESDLSLCLKMIALAKDGGGKRSYVPLRVRHRTGKLMSVVMHVHESMKMGPLTLHVLGIERIDDKELLLTLDAEGQILSCNSSHCEYITGFSQTELLGRNVMSLVVNFSNHVTSPGLSADLSSTPCPGATQAPSSSTGCTLVEEAAFVSPRRNFSAAVLRHSSRESDMLIHDTQPPELEMSDRRLLQDPGVAKMYHALAEKHYNRMKNRLTPPAACGELKKPILYDLEAVKWKYATLHDFSVFSSMKPKSLATTLKIPLLEFKGQLKHRHGMLVAVECELKRFCCNRNNTLGRPAGEVMFALFVRHHMPRNEENAFFTETPLPSSSLLPGSLVGNYQLHEVLGRGSQAVVKRGVDLRTGKVVAVKILRTDFMDEKERDRALLEVRILTQLNHPSICKSIDIITTSECMYIVQEYYKNGDLGTFIKKKGHLNEALARSFFIDLVSAVKYCHENGIMHRDIKHRNILLDSNSRPKLTDFGLSNFFIHGRVCTTFCGTPGYAAPEMLLSQKYAGPEVDVWSLGVILHSMLSGRLPFARIVDTVNGFYCPLRHASADARDLVSKILVVDPGARYTIAEIEKHPWVRKGVTSHIAIPHAITTEMMQRSAILSAAASVVMPSIVPRVSHDHADNPFEPTKKHSLQKHPYEKWGSNDFPTKRPRTEALEEDHPMPNDDRRNGGASLSADGGGLAGIFSCCC
eukprot:CAMPEP_0177672068 /NCGR_PEP_ID=MMETSP0447-20121125/25103_1 /TAXON_ID=0 /ORGANISM="Stygamoeba regulata, Strain BSH-02190019" /LENGTH=851 /DNA_ID=CAMNT_0019179629 /DNA_START=52 /DNA_END=2608 /DNA_ORIENTATION=-